MPAQAAEPAWHSAYSLFGTPKYGERFAHFDYVNPTAPRGGLLRQASAASFDSLNNFILKGQKAPGLDLIYESMMTPSLDEALAYYPQLATRYRLAADKSWMEFEINPAARWQDGKPVTAEDVAFTLEMFKTKADPSYRLLYAPLKSIEIEDARHFIVHFVDGSAREQTILAAGMPILPKHYYATHPFDQTTLEPPIGSGPYKLCGVDAGRSVRYCRVKDYWGRTLSAMVGQNNFDTIRYDVYRDESVALEAFKSGAVDLREEFIARIWATGYDSAALREKKFSKEVIPNKIPQGMQAYFFNLREPKFADRRVRQAIALALDFEWMNKALFYGAYKRNRSFFLNTPFEAAGLPSAEETKLLEPYRANLPPSLFTDAPLQPTTDGTGNDRHNLLRAQALLNEAGWKLKDGVRVSPIDGTPLEIEFLLNQPTMEKVVSALRVNLKKLGIPVRIRIVDSAQYQQRVDNREFDMISLWIDRGIHYPGAEQPTYWHSSQAAVKGSNNISGISMPVVDDLVTRIAHAQTLDDLTPAARALDRVLLSEHIVIPNWHGAGWRLAWWNKFGRPAITPPYGLNTGAWWSKDAK